MLNTTNKSISKWENGNSLTDYTILDSLCNVLGISIKEFYYGEKMFEQEFKFLSEQHLRMYLIEKYGRRLRLKFAVLGGIIGMLIFIIIQLTFNR